LNRTKVSKKGLSNLRSLLKTLKRSLQRKRQFRANPLDNRATNFITTDLNIESRI
jgi:hypothetical protein